MTINSARFITSMSAYGPFDGRGLPEIAACGKSNVGKSSLINSLGRNKKLAKVSSEPGKTRLINAYDFDQKFILIDLPGYGFARSTIGAGSAALLFHIDKGLSRGRRMRGLHLAKE